MPAVPGSKTCKTCRTRKVRCDGARPTCSNCSRLNLACYFGLSRPFHSQDSSPQRIRIRGPRACDSCRIDKVRCSGEAGTCQRCSAKARPCVYSAPRGADTKEDEIGLSRPATVNSPNSNIGAENDTLEVALASPSIDIDHAHFPRQAEQDRLLGAFFSHIYPLLSHSFLHEATIKQLFVDGTFDTPLIMAVCATTAMRLEDPSYPLAVTSSWMHKVEGSLMSHFIEPTIPRLQAMVILCWYWLETGLFRRAFMLSALAVRFASALRLSHDRTDLSAIAKDVRRRLMWSITMLDSIIATGLRDLEMVPAESMYLPLPGHEEVFNNQGETVPGFDNPDLAGICFRLVLIRRDIMRLKRQLVVAKEPVPQITDIIKDFQATLDEIERDNPECYPHSRERLVSYHKTRWLSRYLYAQLSWHQCHCDAYRMFVKGYAEAVPPAVLDVLDEAYMSDAVKRCFHHVSYVVSILSDLYQVSRGNEIIYFDMAFCAYQASRLILFLSGLPKMRGIISRREAVDNANQCLLTIRRFFPKSPTTAAILATLPNLIA
ncbi:hypothetical protein GQ53DRAFT_866032 [Thozetella sp. PMI_491]|nr:hypothetical protein GQ53DRAFT_866032 [Thozetella sp. PMI_491]